MKTGERMRFVALLATGLIFAAYARGQIVDNLANSSAASTIITTTGWSANKFITDNHTYSLQSVTLDMFSAINRSGGFQVQVWSAGAGRPGRVLATLVGNSNPAIAGAHTFTPVSAVILGPDTPYWIVAKVSSGAGAYEWNYTFDTSFTGTGTIGGSSDTVNAGVTWSLEDPGTPSQFSVIAALAVSEPSSAAILWLGVAILASLALSRRAHSDSEARLRCRS